MGRQGGGGGGRGGRGAGGGGGGGGGHSTMELLRQVEPPTAPAHLSSYLNK